MICTGTGSFTLPTVPSRSYQIIVEENSLGMLERLKPSFRAFITFTFVKESQAREATDERTFIDKIWCQWKKRNQFHMKWDLKGQIYQGEINGKTIC